MDLNPSHFGPAARVAALCLVVLVAGCEGPPDPAPTPPPQTAITDGPPPLSRSSEASFTFSSDPIGAVFQCSLDGQDFASCPSPVTFRALVEGPHVLQVRAATPEGSEDPTPAVHAWTVDSHPPTGPTLETPADGASLPEPRPEFAGTAEPGTSVTVRLDPSTNATCAAATDAAGRWRCRPEAALPDGTYEASIDAADAAGNVAAGIGSTRVTIDTVAPTTTLLSRPDALTRETTSTFTFIASEDGARFECSLDGAVSGACESPLILASLGEGPHVLRLRALDAAGNAEPLAPVAEWRMDATPPPSPRFRLATGGPPTDQPRPLIEGTAEPGTTVTVHLGDPLAASCVAITSADGAFACMPAEPLPDGSHVVSAVATDAAGNVSPASSIVLSVDSLAPETAISQAPLEISDSTSATFQFEAGEPATYWCTLDGGAAWSCPAATELVDLSEGLHWLVVYAVDAAGNADASPAMHPWAVDTLGPPVPVISSPGDGQPVADVRPSFRGRADPVTWVQVFVDGASLEACTAATDASGDWACPAELPLTEGAHVVQARARDVPGNASALSAPRSFTVDTQAPETVFVQAPPADASGSTALFTFDATEPGATFHCSLDGAAFVACASPLTLDELAVGTHVLEVQALDVAGNADPTPARHVWGAPQWRPRALQALEGHAMAHDAARQQTVLFGGSDSFAPSDHTWLWNGSKWTFVRPARSPPARFNAAMVYDAARQRVVLFGGLARGGLALDDTWEWDGTTWTQLLPPSAPPARLLHAMAYDPVRQRVVLFGGWARSGSAASALGDVWEWDGLQWSERTPATGPGPRAQTALAFDGASQRVLLFGGYSASSAKLRDTWEWNGVAWTERAPPNSPSARNGHVLVWESARQRVLLFGGSASNYVNETWEWDGTTWAYRAVSPDPEERFLPAAAYDADRGRVVLFGGAGFQGVELDATWEWDGTGWSARTGALPEARMEHALVHDPARGHTVLFGGRGSSAELADTWTWDGEDWEKIPTTGGPPSRSGHALVYDEVRQKVLLFGGTRLGPAPHDFWQWDGVAWTRLYPTSLPPARHAHGMVFDPVRGRVVLFGGYGYVNSTFQPLRDTWEWDGTSWFKVASFGPPGGQEGALVYDAARARVLYLGGSPVSETWEWDGTSWTQLRPQTQPPVIRPNALAFDARRARTVLYGTYADGVGYANSTWEWNGVDWELVPVSFFPEGRKLAAVAYDSNRGRTVLFGGWNDQNRYFRDTWEY